MDIQQIETYLCNHEELWQEMDRHELGLTMVDVCVDLIDDSDYYGVNFSGDRSVYMLFYTGQSNYFPGLHVIKGDRVDESPIYIFDLGSDSSPELIGNFKTYMKTPLVDFINQWPTNNYLAEAKQALLELDQFSDFLCRQDDYQLIINE